MSYDDLLQNSYLYFPVSYLFFTSFKYRLSLFFSKMNSTRVWIILSDHDGELKNWNDIAYRKKLLAVGSSLFLQILFQSMWQVIQFTRYRCFSWLSLSGVMC